MMGAADVDRFSYRFRRSFEDGGHVDARVELSGSRWLYVSTSTALAGIRRLVAGVLADMDSVFGRLTTSHLKYSILWYSVLYWMS